jgi:hypothetical protein
VRNWILITPITTLQHIPRLGLTMSRLNNVSQFGERFLPLVTLFSWQTLLKAHFSAMEDLFDSRSRLSMNSKA